jgi:hypothetical protein
MEKYANNIEKQNSINPMAFWFKTALQKSQRFNFEWYASN